jgi:hypothetical protein
LGWKSDLAILGTLGFAALVVYVERNKIVSFLQNAFGGLGQAAGLGAAIVGSGVGAAYTLEGVSEPTPDITTITNPVTGDVTVPFTEPTNVAPTPSPNTVLTPEQVSTPPGTEQVVNGATGETSTITTPELVPGVGGLVSPSVAVQEGVALPTTTPATVTPSTPLGPTPTVPTTPAATPNIIPVTGETELTSTEPIASESEIAPAITETPALTTGQALTASQALSEAVAPAEATLTAPINQALTTVESGVTEIGSEIGADVSSFVDASPLVQAVQENSLAPIENVFSDAETEFESF